MYIKNKCKTMKKWSNEAYKSIMIKKKKIAQFIQLIRVSVMFFNNDIVDAYSAKTIKPLCFSF